MHIAVLVLFQHLLREGGLSWSYFLPTKSPCSFTIILRRQYRHVIFARSCHEREGARWLAPSCISVEIILFERFPPGGELPFSRCYESLALTPEIVNSPTRRPQSLLADKVSRSKLHGGSGLLRAISKSLCTAFKWLTDRHD